MPTFEEILGQTLPMALFGLGAGMAGNRGQASLQMLPQYMMQIAQEKQRAQERAEERAFRERQFELQKQNVESEMEYRREQMKRLTPQEREDIALADIHKDLVKLNIPIDINKPESFMPQVAQMLVEKGHDPRYVKKWAQSIMPVDPFGQIQLMPGPGDTVIPMTPTINRLTGQVSFKPFLDPEGNPYVTRNKDWNDPTHVAAEYVRWENMAGRADLPAEERRRAQVAMKIIESKFFRTPAELMDAKKRAETEAWEAYSKDPTFENVKDPNRRDMYRRLVGIETKNPQEELETIAGRLQAQAANEAKLANPAYMGMLEPEEAERLKKTVEAGAAIVPYLKERANDLMKELRRRRGPGGLSEEEVTKLKQEFPDAYFDPKWKKWVVKVDGVVYELEPNK